MLKRVAPRVIISDPNFEYIRSQLDTGDANKTKHILQHLCRQYRMGSRVPQERRIGLEQSIIGILNSRLKDEKVRRWALNALALCGSDLSLDPILRIINEISDSPSSIAAAIAALYRIERDETKFIGILKDFDPQIKTLAALQHVSPKKLDLSTLPVKIESASPEILKLCLILLGLKRAPLHLLHPRHSNDKIIKVLGKHHDKIVAQYTVWAIAENDDLSVCDLGIPLSSVESLPANVRSWMYRVIAMSPNEAKENQDLIENGSYDKDIEVRLGLSIGLKDTFFNGLGEIVINWFIRESENEVRHFLFDHMIQHYEKYSLYENYLIEHYEREPPNSSLRRWMEAQSVKTKLHQRFKAILYGGSEDLFRGGPAMISNTTINGDVGVFSIGGDVNNSGTIKVSHQQQTEVIQEELKKAWLAINSLENSLLKQQALAELKSAQANPSKDKISSIINTLEKIESITKKVSSMGTNMSAIGTSIKTLYELLKSIM